MFHTRRAGAVHHAHNQWLVQLVVGRAHGGLVHRARMASTFECTRHRQRMRAAGALDRRGQHLDHGRHAVVNVVVAWRREALAKRRVERVRRRSAHVRVPLGHRVHRTHTGFADGRRCTQRITVEGEELRRQAHLARRLDQQRQVISPVAGDDDLRAAGLNLGCVGQKVLHAPQRMQFVADDRDVGPPRGQQRARLAQHMLAEAVVLAQQVNTLDRRIGAQHFDQRREPHVGVRVEAEVPGAAAFVGQDRIDGRVVEQQRAALRLARVVFVQRLDQRSRCGRAVALGDEADAPIGSRAQQQQRLLGMPPGVEAHDLQRSRAAGQPDAAALIDALGSPQEVAEHRLAGIGKRAR